MNHLDIAWRIGKSKVSSLAIILSFNLILYTGYLGKPFLMVLSTIVFVFLGLLKLGVVTYNEDDAIE